ncbi:barstar family protein [Deinococcus altitudinis]|uniref:barstar family protein n=1 Tax=Deinococcus altitudinis TaxID=468914 RepID=UPI003892A7F0
MNSNPLLSAPVGLQTAPADPQLTAAGIGASLRQLDLSSVDGKAELMHRLARDLSLPPHFGRNWDALADLLSDPQTMKATVICLKGWGDFQLRHGELAGSLESVLLDAQAALAEADIPLWVLV